MRSEAPDSVEILPGKWTLIDPPFIPVGLYNGAANGIGGYTVCTAPTKSYLLGGRTLYPVNNFGYPIYPDYSYQRPKFILEFNSLNKQWLKRMVNNPRQFADIAAQYYNNAIYVMGGVEESENNSYVGHLDKMLKLDLNTMGWSTLDTLPFGKLTYPASTQLNNEFYVGLGEKFISVLSMPDPFGQLWKYNPQMNSWTRMADFPGRFQRYPTMLTLNDKVLVYSGAIPVGALQPHTTFEKELWEFSPASNQWRQLSLPPDSILPQGEKCSIAAVNGKLCFFTAQKNTLYSYYYSMALKQIFIEFNPSNNTWKRFSLPTSGGDLMKVIFQNNNTVFLHSDQFGYTNSNMNQTYQFDRE
jgi:N-acetylneuraminic acid mutarotase